MFALRSTLPSSLKVAARNSPPATVRAPAAAILRAKDSPGRAHQRRPQCHDSCEWVDAIAGFDLVEQAIRVSRERRRSSKYNATSLRKLVCDLSLLKSTPKAHQ